MKGFSSLHLQALQVDSVLAIQGDVALREIVPHDPINLTGVKNAAADSRVTGRAPNNFGFSALEF